VDLGSSNANFGADAYEEGRVFAVNGDGLVRSFDAATGAPAWTRALMSTVTAPPTATGGNVYVANSTGTMFALNESDGGVRWSGHITKGENSSPAVTSEGVYVSNACGSADDLSPTDGSTIWHVGPADCSGHGGTTQVVSGGDLYVRDWINANDAGGNFNSQRVLDARTGALRRTFDSVAPPAISSKSAQGFFLPIPDVNAGAVPQAQALPSGHIQWTYAGSYSFGSNPVVAGDTVFYAVDTGYLIGLNTATGAETFRDVFGLPNEDLPDDTAFGQHAALAAGHGLLVVPARNQLLAYG